MSRQQISSLRRAAKTLEALRDLPPAYASEQIRDEIAEYLRGLANELDGTTEITNSDEDCGPHKTGYAY